MVIVGCYFLGWLLFREVVGCRGLGVCRVVLLFGLGYVLVGECVVEKENENKLFLGVFWGSGGGVCFVLV